MTPDVHSVLPSPHAVVGGNIRAAMARSEVSQRQLADHLGMVQAGVSDRLRGRTPWTLDQLVMVARFLRCRLSDLVPNDIAELVA